MKSISFFLKCFAALMLISSCSLLEGDDRIKFDEDGFPYYEGKGVSESVFLSDICGYGWKEISERRILEDGRLSKDDWMKGGAPSGWSSKDLYIDKTSLTSFFWSNAHGMQNISITQETFFGESCLNRPEVPGYYYRIVSLDGDQLTMISRYYAIDPPVVVYRRMTDEELEYYWQNYPDVNDADEFYASKYGESK